MSCAWLYGDISTIGKPRITWKPPSSASTHAWMLNPAFVRLMTSNHLGAGIQNLVANVEPHRDGYGFGLGVAVRVQPGLAAVPGNPGEFSWNGANGTGFFADPKEQLVVAFGTAAPGELRKYYREQVQDLVYGAINR